MNRPFIWILIAACLFATTMGAAAAAIANIHAIEDLHAITDNPVPDISPIRAGHPTYLSGVRAFASADYENAIQVFSQLHERPGLAHFLTLQSLYELDDWQAVLDSVDYGSTREMELFVRTLAANDTELGQTEKSHYLDLLRQHPHFLFLYVHHLFSLGRFQDALDAVEGVTDSEWQNTAQLYEARAYFYMRDYDKARNILFDLLTKDHHPLYLYWYGRTRFDLGEQQEGLEDVRRSLDEMGKSPPVDLALSYAGLQERAGSCQTALEIIRSMLGNDTYHRSLDSIEKALEAVQQRC